MPRVAAARKSSISAMSASACGASARSASIAAPIRPAQALAVQQAVHLLDQRDAFGAEAAALQAFG
jgi:hypothetical protein